MVVKARQKLGKYHLERRIASGGFAEVWQARDTVEGIRVALKIPHKELMTKSALEGFRREVRLTARLDHPNILPIKTAEQVGSHFVIVYPMGEESLGERMRRRLSTKKALSYVEQMIEAVAHAHANRIIHQDLKPENFIVFPGERLRLADFGIAKVQIRTISGSGTGTVGYMAPEQAMGRPSLRSDVFSLGLICWQLFTGLLPVWPFDHPLEGRDVLKQKTGTDFVAFLEKAIQVDERKRYADAQKMLAAFRKVKPKALGRVTRQKKKRRLATTGKPGRDWREVRFREFQRAFGKELETRHHCRQCNGPIAESMRHCPWCGNGRARHSQSTTHPARCPRCRRGVRLDWKFCPWCYGQAIGPKSDRTYTDKRYSGRCTNPRCTRKELPAFARYCPWCRTRISRPWKIEGSRSKCAGCSNAVLPHYWEYCPWCGRDQRRR